MSNVIGFPYGFRGDGNGPVDPPCECKDGVGAIHPEGYALKHLHLPDPKAEPTSSHPFPWIRVITVGKRCYAAIQLEHDQRIEIEIDNRSALDMIASLGTHLRATLRLDES